MIESFANFLSGGIIDKLKKSNDLLIKELDSVKSDLERSNEKVTSLKKTLLTIENECNSKEATINDLNMRIESFLSSLKKIIAEKDMYKAEHLQSLNEIETKDNKINNYEERLQEQALSIEKFSTEIEELKKTNSILTEHLSEAKKQSEKTIVNNHEDSFDRNSNNLNTPEAIHLNTNELVDRLETLEREKIMMNEKLAKSERKYENLQIDYSVTNSYIEVYKKRIEELENELKSLKPVDDSNAEVSVSVVDRPITDSGNAELQPIYQEIPKQLTIDKVIDIEHDQEIDAREFFSQSEDNILHMRRTLQEAIIMDRPKFVCKYCGQMVKISGRNTERGRASFFSHLYDSDACDLKTTTGLSQALINARKYGEYGESTRHKRLKKILEDALNDTNSVKKGITDVQKEKTVFGLHPLFRWRRPDIYIKYNDIEIVFELQLSTTFASVIAEREMFYKMNNIFIIWVFNFDENEEHVDLRNLMMKDIYYENCHNVFVFDNEAIKESLKRKELVLKCDWLEKNGKWHYSGNENYGSKGVFVTLSDLTYNTATYKPFYFDTSLEQVNPDTNKESNSKEAATKIMLDLLDKKYQKILQRQQQEEVKRRIILDALDVDSIEHEYIRLNVATVKKDNLFGLYNFVERKEILPAVYRSIKLWNNSRFFLVEDEHFRFGLVNTKGEAIVPLEYDSISRPEDGVAIGIYKDEGTCLKMSAFINMYRHDSFSINKGFINLEETGNGIYISTKSNNGIYLKGLVSRNGHIIADNLYTNISAFSNGLYIAVRKGKYGLLNEKGDTVLAFKYDKISPASDGKAEITLDDKTDYLDSEGHFICDARKIVKATLGTEKRKILNEWRVYDKNNMNLSKQGYEEICHYQGHIVSFTSNSIVSEEKIWADKECGLEAELTEKTKTGLLFKFGSRVAKMNKRQLQRKPKDVSYEKGKTYMVYVSCIKEDLNLIYLSPIPCYGPTIQNKKSNQAHNNKR